MTEIKLPTPNLSEAEREQYQMLKPRWLHFATIAEDARLTDGNESEAHIVALNEATRLWTLIAPLEMKIGKDWENA